MFKSIAIGAARAVPELIRDVIALGAAGAIAYGVWLIYQPAGFVVGGILVLFGLYLQVAGSRTHAGG
jgi:hypothetical protein